LGGDNLILSQGLFSEPKGYIQTFRPEGQHLPEYEGILGDSSAEDEREIIRLKRAQLMQNLLIDPLSLNFGLVGLAVTIGWLILKALVVIESLSWGQTGVELMVYVPLFPMTLVGGIIVQLTLGKLGLSALIIRPLMDNLAGLALDIVVVSALASISLKVLGSNLGPFLILSIAGIVWNIFAFVYLAPRLIPSYWFERGIGDMGQSMGVTATGILLLRMVDPENKSGAFESFAYKQLFFEPIVGGGLFTAAAPVLIAKFEPVAILVLTWIIHQRLKPSL
jgi:ESS family glutamate:Na+ symporter